MAKKSTRKTKRTAKTKKPEAKQETFSQVYDELMRFAHVMNASNAKQFLLTLSRLAQAHGREVGECK